VNCCLHISILYNVSCRVLVLAVYVCVCAVKENRLELSTPSSARIYSTAVAQHELTQKSKGQNSRPLGYENHHNRMVASEMCCCGRVLLLTAWNCTSYGCLGF